MHVQVFFSYHDGKEGVCVFTVLGAHCIYIPGIRYSRDDQKSQVMPFTLMFSSRGWDFGLPFPSHFLWSFLTQASWQAKLHSAGKATATKLTHKT